MTMTGGISSDGLMKTLSDDAKTVLGCCYGVFATPGRSRIAFGMKKSRPTARVQAALDELAEAGAVARVPDPEGGVEYVVQIDCSDFGRWARRNRSKTKFPLTEPVDGTEADPPKP